MPSEPVLVAMNGVRDVRMARQSVQLPQLVHQIEVELLERDQQRVERRRVMSLRREVDVGDPGSPLLGSSQLLRPQPRDQVGGAEARSDVAGSGAHDHVERVDAAEIGEEPHARATASIGASRTRAECRQRHVPERGVVAKRTVGKVFFTHRLLLRCQLVSFQFKRSC